MKYTFMRFPQFRYKAVTLSYDDNVVYDKKLLKIIDEYGLKCTFNLNSGRFSENDGGRMMTEKETKSLFADSVHEIAVHGENHMSLAECDRAFIAKEILSDRIAFEKLFGRIVKGMAYANGSYDDKTIEVLKSCGIKYARTTASTEKFDIPTDWLRLNPTCHHYNPKLNELAEGFLKDYDENDNYKHKTPKLFYMWGHAYEFNDRDNWQVLEDFCRKIGGRSDVWYATNVEVYDYVKAYESLEYSADGTIIKNPSATDVYLNYFGENVVVKSGQTVKTRDFFDINLLLSR